MVPAAGNVKFQARAYHCRLTDLSGGNLCVRGRGAIPDQQVSIDGDPTTKEAQSGAKLLYKRAVNNRYTLYDSRETMT